MLFLDELPEFKRSALEVLRQPLEDGHVTISRSAGKITLPCHFMLVAAMNPCPCGYLGDTRHECRCSPSQIKKFCHLDSSLGDLLQQAMEQLALSARAYDRILKVARTIADLADAEQIAAPHLLEAIQYRSLDRNVFY